MPDKFVKRTENVKMCFVFLGVAAARKTIKLADDIYVTCTAMS